MAAAHIKTLLDEVITILQEFINTSDNEVLRTIPIRLDMIFQEAIPCEDIQSDTIDAISICRQLSEK